MFKKNLAAITFLLLLPAAFLHAQVKYPAPLHYIHLRIENKKVKMAYMDIPATTAGDKTILLLHGKNFNGY